MSRSEAGLNRQDENPGKIHNLVIRAILLRWRFTACLPQGLLPAGWFFSKTKSEVAGPTFPGMGETATFGGFVNLQTHG